MGLTYRLATSYYFFNSKMSLSQSTLNMRSRVNHKRESAFDLEEPHTWAPSAGKPVRRSWRKLAVFAVGATLLALTLFGTTSMTCGRRRMGEKEEKELAAMQKEAAASLSELLQRKSRGDGMDVL